jgi:hypothetical protein
MTPCVQVVQTIENHIKLFEKINVELLIFDIGMMSHNLNAWSKLEYSFSGYLGWKAESASSNIVLFLSVCNLENMT